MIKQNFDNLIECFIAFALYSEIDHGIRQAPTHVELQRQVVHPLAIDKTYHSQNCIETIAKCAYIAQGMIAPEQSVIVGCIPIFTQPYGSRAAQQTQIDQ